MAGCPQTWSYGGRRFASGLAKGIKDVLERCAAAMDVDYARQLRKASTHWSRRMLGSHALDGRPGGKPVTIR